MGWDRLGEWIATGLVAALTWTAGLGAVAPAASAPAEERGQQVMLGWAQSTDEPAIEQVGEGDASDPETLDEGQPPAQTTGAAASQSGDDVELLDQGSPPTTATSTTAPAPAATTPTDYQAPAAPAASTTTTEYVAPAQQMGPVLPPGFGSGRVHVSAGRSGFPVGLEECSVGVVTGRAYVGLDCGDQEDVVGHARSFDDFPFIPEVDFPFEGDEEFFTNPDFPLGGEDERATDSGFFASGGTDDDAETRLVVSAGDGASGATDDEIGRRGGVTTGNGSVELAQRTRDRDARVRVNDGARKSGKNGKKDKKGKSDNVSSASNDNDDSNTADKDNGKKSKDNDKDNAKSKSKRQKNDSDNDKAKAKSEKRHHKAKGDKQKHHRDKREKRRSSKDD